jgi:hypothetical protein
MHKMTEMNPYYQTALPDNGVSHSNETLAYGIDFKGEEDNAIRTTIICNPTETRTWIRTGMVLVLVFFMTLGVSYYIASKQVFESMTSNNDGGGTVSEEQKEYYRRRFLAIRPIVGNRFTDQADLITPFSPQAKALEWIIYKDTIIQIQEITGTNEVSNKSTTAAMVDTNNTIYGLDETNLMRLQQRYSAMVLFYACSGETWQQDEVLVPRADLLYNQSECSFAGFQCNDGNNGQEDISDTSSNVIRTLNMRGYRAAGQLPSEIGLLTALTSLNLAGNLFIGTLPSTIFDRLSNLGKSVIRLRQ